MGTDLNDFKSVPLFLVQDDHNNGQSVIYILLESRVTVCRPLIFLEQHET